MAETAHTLLSRYYDAYAGELEENADIDREVYEYLRAAPPVAVPAPTDETVAQLVESIRLDIYALYQATEEHVCPTTDYGRGRIAEARSMWLAIVDIFKTAAPTLALLVPTEPSGATELPELDVNHPYYAEAGREWNQRVPKDFAWSPFEVRLIEERMQRDRQLRDYKAKYEAALRRIEELETPLGTVNGPHNPSDECPTYYDGCHCTVKALVHNIARAEKAEGEHEAALQEIKRLEAKHG